MALWPEKQCLNIWLPCPPINGSREGPPGDGMTTFAGWGVHVATIDMFVAAVAFLIWFSIIRGYIPNDSFCCPLKRKVVETYNEYLSEHSAHDVMDDRKGPRTFCISMMCFCISFLVGGVLLSYYIGPIIAMSWLPQCKQYAGTIVGYYTPQKCMVFANQTGWIEFTNLTMSTECHWCQSTGFCILFFSLIGYAIIVWVSVLLMIFYIKQCVKRLS